MKYTLIDPWGSVARFRTIKELNDFLREDGMLSKPLRLSDIPNFNHNNEFEIKINGHNPFQVMCDLEKIVAIRGEPMTKDNLRKKISNIIYDYVYEEFGESEAEDPSWEIQALAKAITDKVLDNNYKPKHKRS